MATYLVKFEADGYTGSVPVNCGSPAEAEEYVKALHPHQAAMHFEPPMDKDEAHDRYGNKIANPNVPNSHVIQGRPFKMPLKVVNVERVISAALKAIMAEHGLVEKA